MAVKSICGEYSIESPVVNFVYEVIVKQKNPKTSFKDLWNSL